MSHRMSLVLPQILFPEMNGRDGLTTIQCIYIRPVSGSVPLTLAVTLFVLYFQNSSAPIHLIRLPVTLLFCVRSKNNKNISIKHSYHPPNHKQKDVLNIMSPKVAVIE